MTVTTAHPRPHAQGPQALVRRLALLLFLLGAVSALHAASGDDDDAFYRLELGVGGGFGFGLNDVNSKLYGTPTPAAALLARFPLNPRMAVKVSGGYLKVSGTTDKILDFYPANPAAAGTARLHYEAKGNLYDLNALFELHFLPYGWVKSYQGFKRIVPYLQGGLGLTYSDAGKVATVNIPIGFGVKWKIAPRVNLGLDWTFHFTPNDKLEGLANPHGIKSGEFRNKDHYNLTLVTLTYDLSPKCPTCNKD